MPRGALPDPNHRHRNAPTIPTTDLPAGGRKGKTPRVPSWVALGKEGKAWWRWAWSTPQACAWSEVAHSDTVARRASLEDDVARTAQVEGLDLLEALDGETFQSLKLLIARLSSLATSRLNLFKEMRELDDRLGLSPKGMAALRWTIVESPVEATTSDEVSSRRANRRERLAS